MYKYVFLDLDDTIWDFHANAEHSLRTAYNTLSLDNYFENFETFFRLYIKRNNELWDLYGAGELTKDFLQAERFRYPLRQAGAENDELAEKIGETYLKLLPERTILVPHAQELLEYLYEKYPLTIVSNGFAEIQEKKLTNSRIKRYFRHIVLSEDAGALKPDKKIFEHALRLNRAAPEETVMIGDIFQADIVGAQRAGIDQIFYNQRKYQFQENESATYTVSSLQEVFEIL